AATNSPNGFGGPRRFAASDESTKWRMSPGGGRGSRRNDRLLASNRRQLPAADPNTQGHGGGSAWPRGLPIGWWPMAIGALNEYNDHECGERLQPGGPRRRNSRG